MRILQLFSGISAAGVHGSLKHKAPIWFRSVALVCSAWHYFGDNLRSGFRPVFGKWWAAGQQRSLTVLCDWAAGVYRPAVSAVGLLPPAEVACVQEGVINSGEVTMCAVAKSSLSV